MMMLAFLVLSLLWKATLGYYSEEHLIDSNQGRLLLSNEARAFNSSFARIINGTWNIINTSYTGVLLLLYS